MRRNPTFLQKDFVLFGSPITPLNVVRNLGVILDENMTMSEHIARVCRNCYYQRPKPSNHWFTPALQKLKSTRRHLEKIWSRTHSTSDLKLLKSATNHYHTSIIKAKKLYNSTLLSSNLTNPKKLWNTINKLLHRIAKPSFPFILPS